MKSLIGGIVVAAILLTKCYGEPAEAEAVDGRGAPNPANNLPRMRPRQYADYYGPEGGRQQHQRHYVERFDDYEDEEDGYGGYQEEDYEAPQRRRHRRARLGRRGQMMDAYEGEEEGYGPARPVRAQRRHPRQQDYGMEEEVEEVRRRPLPRRHHRRAAPEEARPAPEERHLHRRRQAPQEDYEEVPQPRLRTVQRRHRRPEGEPGEPMKTPGRRVGQRRPLRREAPEGGEEAPRLHPIRAHREAGAGSGRPRRRRHRPERKEEPIDPVQREHDIMAEAMRLLEHNPPPFGKDAEGYGDEQDHGHLQDISLDAEEAPRPRARRQQQQRRRRPVEAGASRRRRRDEAKIPREVDEDFEEAPIEAPEQSEDSLLIPMPEWMLYAQHIEEDASSRDFIFTTPDKIVKPAPPPGSTIDNPDVIQKRSFLRPVAFAY